MQEIIPKPVAMQNDTPSEFALRSFVKKSLAPNTVFGTARR
jgi:hypothetical protein